MSGLFEPFRGILNQEKYLRLKYCPLHIELELVADASEPVVSQGANI